MSPAIPADKGQLCLQGMKWVLSHLPEPASALGQWYPREGAEPGRGPPRIVILTSGAALRLLRTGTLYAWSQRYRQEAGQPPTPRAHLGGRTRGFRRRRAVPKSAHCGGIRVIWGYSMLLRVPMTPFTRFMYYGHTSQPGSLSRANPESGHQSHRPRQPSLNTHGDRAGGCYVYIRS